MTENQFRHLQVGDLIRHPHICGAEAMVVTAVHSPKHVTAAITVEATNPVEWDLLQRATSHEHPYRDTTTPKG
jgi:hypothetical protein